MADPLAQVYNGLRATLLEAGEAEWVDPLLAKAESVLSDPNHGDFHRWQQALLEMPAINPAAKLDQDTVALGEALGDTEQLRSCLEAMIPWRKGPWNLAGLKIDTEWRSDWKWQRIAPHLNLADKRILDVGCGNGYYGYRMLGSGARWVMGTDPGLLFVMQFLATRRAAPELPLWVLPLGIEALPESATGFDTVFSMGVLYHRHDHHQHLQQLYSLLAPGAELVLETLVLNETSENVLLPSDRYANMRNVHAVPALPVVERWLAAAGFVELKRLDVTPTRVEEQRSTDWMPFWSLGRALKPDNHAQTVEGHPAPVRAVWQARRPS